MISTLLHLLRLWPFLCGGHRQLALENLALRQQLTVYKRTVTPPRLRRGDRLFWVRCPGCGEMEAALVIVAPDTVLRWRRRRFRLHWTTLSGRPTGGRPPVSPEIRALVCPNGRSQSALGRPQNPWRAPEARHRRRRAHRVPADPQAAPPPSQTWRTFLTNHVRDLVSIDFFTVPTARLRVLFVLVVLAHHRRRVVHFNVTEHPTAHWTAQQIVEAFPNATAPSYLLRDRDRVYGERFQRRVKDLGIDEVLTTPHSPWQNPFVARLIGSVRRECLDHVLVLERAAPARILRAYFAYYHRARTHLSLDKDAPDVRPIRVPAAGAVVPIREVGGLHHRYVRRAA